jgi:hypothetical protein
MNSKEIVLNNIIGINPTGTLDFEGTFKMNGTNNIVQNSQTASKENLEKAQTNQIICNNEHFTNYDNDNRKNWDFKKYILLFFILIIIIIIIIIILRNLK